MPLSLTSAPDRFLAESQEARKKYDDSFEGDIKKM